MSRASLPGWAFSSTISALVAMLAVCCPGIAAAQSSIGKLIIDVRTADNLFAGTDDPIQLQIGGQTFGLDNPEHDDFERGHTDRFELTIPPGRLSLEVIRAVGELSITKLDDSFWGGGWDFAALTIWAETDASQPIYANANVNDTLDGDHLQWRTTTDQPGWHVPEPPPFPPCTIGDVDTGLLFDADCDGIPDDSDPTFNPTDTDGDGLPDGYETQTGSDPGNPDSDGDGWWDASNRRALLLLKRIRCLDEDEDVGRDEIYLVSEEVRFPTSASLDAYWLMNDGTEVFPGVIVDSRVARPAAAGGAPLSFRTRLRLREADPALWESPTDDTYKVFDVTWGENGTFQVEHQGDDAHYILELVSVTVKFADPDVHSATADGDADALNDRTEFLIAMQDASVEASPVPGYSGLSDPVRRDLFVEIDAVGSDNTVPYDARQMVVSQFYFHDIAMRLDAAFSSSAGGHLGGGQVLDYEETLTMTKLQNDYKSHADRFAPQRASYYRYALFSDKVEGEGCYGVGRFPPGRDFIVAHFRLFCWHPDFGHTLIAQYSPILIMHEMGHTLGLCHRSGDKPLTVSGSCPPSPGTPSQCMSYCAVGQGSTTAMGSDTTFDIIFENIIEGTTLAGIGAGIVVGGLIGGIPGAIIGGLIGGLLGDFLGGLFGANQADYYRRFVDYDPREWPVLRF